MPGTISSATMFEHMVHAVSGANGMHDLMMVAAPKSGEDFEAGAVVSLDSNDQLIAGCGDVDMPLFAKNGVNDLDANSEVGNTSGGYINVYVATGGYEVFSTEFDKTVDYPVNQLLTADTVTAGNIAKADTYYNDSVVVGQVSRTFSSSDKTLDKYGTPTLYFWTLFIPKVEISG